MIEFVYDPNPQRGCGRKRAGGFYVEGRSGPGGRLYGWTWVLGEGLEGGVNCYVNIPPRRSVYGNLAATLAIGEFVSADVPFAGSASLYERLKKQTAIEAVFDHVGSQYYTASQFAKETVEFGPSRRVTPKLAEELARRVPMPVVFTHGRIPVFRDSGQSAKAIDLAEQIVGFVLDCRQPTWLQAEWGIYAKNDWHGEGHYLATMLAIVSRLDAEWHLVKDNPLYQEAKALFDQVMFVEQPFGVSWITHVGYVPKKGEDKAQVAQQLAQKGIEVIDIEGEENEVE